MNYKDYEMLNQSMAGLGETLMKNRMLAESKAEREQAKTERESDREEAKRARAVSEDMAKQQLNWQVLQGMRHNRLLEQQGIDVTNEKIHRDTREKLADTANASKELESKIKNTMSMLQSQVLANSKDPKKGFSNQEANKHWVDFLKMLTPAQQQGYKTSPFYTMWEDGSFDWSSLATAKTSKENTVTWEITQDKVDPTPSSRGSPGVGIGPLRFGEKPSVPGTSGRPAVEYTGTGTPPAELLGGTSPESDSTNSVGRYKIIEAK